MVSCFVNVHCISGSENTSYLFLWKTDLGQLREFLDLKDYHWVTDLGFDKRPSEKFDHPKTQSSDTLNVLIFMINRFMTR